MDSITRNEAAKRTKLSDVYLRDSSVTLSEGFEPKYTEFPDLFKIEQSISATKAEIFNDCDNEVLSIQFETECKIYSDGSNQTTHQQVLIKVVFIVEYVILERLKEDDWLSEFARINASIHIWPYWREFVQDVCARIRFPKTIILPMYPHSSEG